MTVYDDPRLYTVHRWQRPAGVYPRWIIVHDPGNDAAAPTAIWRYLRQNSAQSCYHRLLWTDAKGVNVAILAPWTEWVGHAGVATRIPRTAIVNRLVNYWTISLSVCTYGKRTPPGSALFEATADEAARVIRTLNMPDAGVVLAHREISTIPGRRTDPRGMEMNELRAAIHRRLT